MTVVDRDRGVPDRAGPADDVVWVRACAVDDLVPERGVCVLAGYWQVALFKTGPEDSLYAISNFDPFSNAYVLSRGIVGTRGDVPKVASPIYKQSFDLRTGVCLDEPSQGVRAFSVRVVDGIVEVGVPWME